MAKLHNYYVLCPLIDQKSFLGVSKDKKDKCVIVSLGRNVVNKYRLTDQKQLSGWTSKDHITSTIVYDADQKSYIGVFNNNTIKIWHNHSDNLDKVKKHKFSIDIHKILPQKTKPSLVVFSNGQCASLPYALDNRKTYDGKPLLNENEVIADVIHSTPINTTYMTYVIRNVDQYEILNCPLREEIGDLDKSKLIRMKISRSDVHVVGKTIIKVKEVAMVYVLWSDSKLTVYDLNNMSWNTVGTVPWVSTKSNVSISSMGKNHIIFFGCNKDQDGAILVAYNTTLGIGLCKYPMKMYPENAKLYCINSRIILEATNHIGVIPYILKTKRNLATLLGSHEEIQDEPMTVVQWDTSIKAKDLKSNIYLKDCINLGLGERTVCSQVIQNLIEKKNTNMKRISGVLKVFKDIPESTLVLTLKMAIKSLDPSKLDLTNQENIISFCSGTGMKLDPLEKINKFNVLNQLLKITYCDAFLIPCLRNGFELRDALFLLTYITYLLVDSECPLDTEYERKLVDWCTVLMDAFYQQFLIKKDDEVTFVLENTQNVVKQLIDDLKSVNDAMMLVQGFLYGKSKKETESNLSYAIEIMEI